MPPKKNPGPAEDLELDLTIVEMKLLNAVLKSCPPSAKPGADWDAAPKKLGLAAGKGPRDRFTWYKHVGGDYSGAKATPVKQSLKRAKSSVNDEGDGLGDNEATPATKKRKTGTKKT
ncbi:Uu.00g065930.m01.CDS01 [Anthostomella pinea]|uniref:Uu.00g065930.m01.CDS01 n=1 Tax=Anthostomella pinea TaxID=933095 RepID=A0AAI8YN76_9PEZI|nr:Uu.00g065930.m01.CDS01 [Anthostomella pinea]